MYHKTLTLYLKLQEPNNTWPYVNKFLLVLKITVVM